MASLRSELVVEIIFVEFGRASGVSVEVLAARSEDSHQDVFVPSVRPAVDG